MLAEKDCERGRKWGGQSSGGSIIYVWRVQSTFLKDISSFTSEFSPSQNLRVGLPLCSEGRVGAIPAFLGLSDGGAQGRRMKEFDAMFDWKLTMVHGASEIWMTGSPTRRASDNEWQLWQCSIRRLKHRFDTIRVCQCHLHLIAGTGSIWQRELLGRRQKCRFYPVFITAHFGVSLSSFLLFTKFDFGRSSSRYGKC
jgi:hypothetical protein